MDFLFRHVWWIYDPLEVAPAEEVYHYFNLLEALAWLTFAALVLIRFSKFRRSSLELAYSLAFLCFGLTDIQEAWALTSWLIWLKLGNLIALLWLRAFVIKHFYPASKLF